MPKNPRATGVIDALRSVRSDALERIFDILTDRAKWSNDAAYSHEEVIKVELSPLLDYLEMFLRTGDRAWQSLYAGHVIEQVRNQHESVDSNHYYANLSLIPIGEILINRVSSKV
jgi:hypothetical protein